MRKVRNAVGRLTYRSRECVRDSTEQPTRSLKSSAVKQLRATEEFQDMEIQTDEDEHSIEMHLPYVRKVFEG